MMGSILIVSRNNLHLTKRAVASAVDQDSPCNVMVIDNASNDGTREWLRTKKVTGVNLTERQSLSACWNMGLKALWCNSYSPVLVLNNDVEIRTDTYSVLRKFLYTDPHAKFVTGVSVRTYLEMEKPIEIGDVMDRASPHPDFSCFMIDKGVYSTVGEFDEQFYPAFYEDNDYHVRMHRAEIEAVSIPLPFLHHGSQTLANAHPMEAAFIRNGAANCKDYFKSKYGCVPSTPEYDALFISSPSSGAQ